MTAVANELAAFAVANGELLLDLIFGTTAMPGKMTGSHSGRAGWIESLSSSLPSEVY